jgi:hypothetical protein
MFEVSEAPSLAVECCAVVLAGDKIISLRYICSEDTCLQPVN